MSPILPVRGYLTPRQAAARLGLKVRKVRELIHRGPLVAKVRHGSRALWIADADLEAFERGHAR